MGSFKGYSLLINSSSTGKPARKVTIPTFVLFQFVTIMLLLTTMTAISVVKFSQLGVVKFNQFHANQTRLSLVKSYSELQNLSEKYKTTINNIVSEDDQWRITYGLAPLDRGMLRASVGGVQLPSTIAERNMEDYDIVSALELQEQFESFSRQTYYIDSTLIRVRALVQQKQARLRETPSVWPTTGNSTSGYGYRIHPITGVKTFHDGVDIANREWTPIYAPADGVVSKAHSSTGGYGKVIVLEHGNSGYVTKYAHLNDMLVVKDAVVKRGELIAYMGNTGRSTGSHLHYEVIHNGRQVNPRTHMLVKRPAAE